MVTTDGAARRAFCRSSKGRSTFRMKRSMSEMSKPARCLFRSLPFSVLKNLSSIGIFAREISSSNGDRDSCSSTFSSSPPFKDRRNSRIRSPPSGEKTSSVISDEATREAVLFPGVPENSQA